MAQRELDPNLPATIEEWADLQSWLYDLDDRSRLAHQRELGRKSLYYLVRYILGVRVIEHPWLLARAMEVQADPDGFLDLWAREHAKTLLISTGLTLLEILQSHGEDPDPYHEGIELTFGLFSFNRTLARSIIDPIRKWSEENELLRSLYPDIIWQNPKRQAKPWTQDFLLFKRQQHRREMTIEAWGLVDSSPTGKHFDRLIFDDVLDQKSVGSEGMIEKTTNAWRLALPLGRVGGKVRYIGTRYHYFDTYAVIIDSKAAVERIKPATEDGTPEGKPVLVSEEHLEAKYRELGPYNFSAQYLLDPRTSQTQAFDEAWLNWYDGDMLWGNLNTYICVDPAGDGKYRRSDHTTMWVVGLGADNHFYAIDVVRDKINLSDRSDILFALAKKYRPKNVMYETYGAQTDVPHLELEMRRKPFYFPLQSVGGNRLSKNDRIRWLIPSMQEGRWHFPRTKFYTRKDGKTDDVIRIFLEEELKPFPLGRHPDLLDSLSRMLDPNVSLIWPDGEAPAEPVIQDRYKRLRHQLQHRTRRRSWMAA